MNDLHDISVSDHAIVRFMERVLGTNIENIRSNIREMVRDALDAKATSITIDGFCYTLDPINRSVISVLAPGMRSNSKKMSKRQCAKKHWLRNGRRRVEMDAS
jgi:hypothetical protein